MGFSDDEEMSQGSESDDTTVGVANEVDQGDDMEELAEEDKTEEVLEDEGEIEAVTPDNCIRVLEGSCSTDEVAASMPDFESNDRWEIVVRSSGAVLSKTRCIVGRSLKTDCRLHSVSGSPCKLHLDICGDFHRLNAQLMLWSIAGQSMTAEQHKDVAASLSRI